MDESIRTETGGFFIVVPSRDQRSVMMVQWEVLIQAVDRPRRCLNEGFFNRFR
jgi:hypothetical protein